MSETNRPNIFIVRLLFCLPGILSILGLEPALSHGKNVLLSASRLPWQLAYNCYCLCFLIKSPVKAHGRGGMKLVGGSLHVLSRLQVSEPFFLLWQKKLALMLESGL